MKEKSPMGKSGGGVGPRNHIFYMISEDYFLNIPEKKLQGCE